jgi:hypothetical protein
MRIALIERIKQSGLPTFDRPLPVGDLGGVLQGNDDYGSIGCNLSPSLSPKFFYDTLRLIRSQSDVQDVLVEVNEVIEEDPEAWPFFDRVYIYADATPQDIAHWAESLHPDSVDEGFIKGKPDSAPDLSPGFKCLWSGGTSLVGRPILAADPLSTGSGRLKGGCRPKGLPH